MRKYFILLVLMMVSMGLSAQSPMLTTFEYWWNDAFNDRASSALSGETTTVNQLLDASTLRTGMHRLSYRIKDSRGVWSQTDTHYFVKVASQNGENALATFEYWWNDAFNDRTSSALSGETTTVNQLLDASTLRTGMHRLSYRIKDSRGVWSQTDTHYFMKVENKTFDGDNAMVGYKYWFNQNDTTATEVSIDPTNPFTEKLMIDVTGVAMKQTPASYQFKPSPSNGDHRVVFGNEQTLLMQFKDRYGRWSSTQIDTFAHDYTVQVHPIKVQSSESSSYSIPKPDSLHYYMFDALVGDSLVLSLDRNATIDFFDPYGKKLRTLVGDNTKRTEGVRAALDGTYYAIVHTFTGTTSGNYQVTYNHIAKYAVLGYNVKKVGNKGITSITFEGNGFDDKTRVTLSKESIVVKPDTIVASGLGKLTAWFNFTGVQIGMYDLTVDFGEEQIEVKNGLEVEGAKPIELSVSIVGATVFRPGVPTTYTITVENKGNATAHGVPLNLTLSSLFPKNISNIQFSDNIPKPYLSEDIDLSRFEKETADSIQMFFDNFKGIDFFIERFDLSNQKHYLLNDLILTIDAKSSFTFSITLTANSEFELNASLPKTWETMTIGPSDASSIQTRGIKPCCILSAMDCLISIVDTYLSLFTAAPIDSKCIYENLKQGGWLYALSWGCDIAEEEYTHKGAANNAWITIANTILGCIELKGKLDVMNKIKDVIGMVMTCGETISSIVSGDCFDDPIEDKVNSQPIRSYDPNDKIGYRSPAGSTYFNDEKKNFTYVINFENDAEKATAAAQEVFITDTLDLAMFDINSFRAGFIKIGSRVIQAPFDVQEHTWQVDLRPEMELRAEVKLTLDKTTGIARWHFKSIDPMTGELTTDPWAGFLPINDEKGSGQGLVSFSIDLKADIEEEAAVVNRAEIVFDTNEPLITDPWENIKDITPPISQMNQPAMVNESVVSLSWNATDNGSGVYRYALWANLDGGNFYQVAGDLSSTNYDFNYFPDHRYTFFVMATDSAMNKEAKTEGEVEFIVRSVKDIAVTPLEATIKVGETVQLTAVFDPTNATNQNTTWESSNLLAADVTQTGWVTGIGAGVSTITATSEEGGKSASAKITVSTPTGVDEATELTKVYTIEKRIIIEAPIGSACRIVTMSGAVVRTFTITEKIHEIGLPDGSYIVEIGDKRMKVVI